MISYKDFVKSCDIKPDKSEEAKQIHRLNSWAFRSFITEHHIAIPTIGKPNNTIKKILSDENNLESIADGVLNINIFIIRRDYKYFKEFEELGVLVTVIEDNEITIGNKRAFIINWYRENLPDLDSLFMFDDDISINLLIPRTGIKTPVSRKSGAPLVALLNIWAVRIMEEEEKYGAVIAYSGIGTQQPNWSHESTRTGFIENRSSIAQAVYLNLQVMKLEDINYRDMLIEDFDVLLRLINKGYLTGRIKSLTLSSKTVGSNKIDYSEEDRNRWTKAHKRLYNNCGKTWLADYVIMKDTPRGPEIRIRKTIPHYRDSNGNINKEKYECIKM